MIRKNLKLIIGGTMLFIAGQICGAMLFSSIGPSSSEIALSDDLVLTAQAEILADIPPSSTPIPTATAVPSPTPGLSAEEAAYTDSMLDILAGYRETMDELSDLTGEAANDALLLFDDNWIARTTFMLLDFQDLASNIYAIDPVPEKFTSFHEIMLSIADETITFIANFSTGVDTFDSNLIDMANLNVMEINRLAQEAQLEINNLDPFE